MSPTPTVPHVALFPSAGMGHLMPFLRLATMLAKQSCLVTLITAQPTVSVAESDHISSFLHNHPQVKQLQLQLDVCNFKQPNSTTVDPFFRQFDSINQSIHLLHPLLSSQSPPFSAIFADFLVAAKIAPIASNLQLPLYIVSTTSVSFLAIMAYLPVLASSPTEFNCASTEVKVPGLPPLPISIFPPVFLDSQHIFTANIIPNSQALSKAKGILMNTFEWFETSTLAALNKENAIESLPPILPVGPLETCDLQGNSQQYLSWLDKQPSKSVVYVSFGSRTAMSRDQVRELGTGLGKSGYKFFWVLKTSKVDKDDRDDVKDFLDDSLLETTKDKGIIIKAWVRQQEILAHPSIGGFLSHCGWNSVMEAARQGVPVLAWPQHGDQRVNALVLEDAGLGMWERNWGLGGYGLVKGEEIEKKIVELMSDKRLRERAKKVKEEAREAVGRGGSSYQVMKEVVESLVSPL